MGATIAALGDVWQYLFLVETDMMNAIKESSEGHSLLVASIGTGEVYWGKAFFYDDAPNIVTLQAREKTRLLVWSRAALLLGLLANGTLSWELCRLMIRCMEHASEIFYAPSLSIGCWKSRAHADRPDHERKQKSLDA